MKANDFGQFVKTFIDLLSKSGSRDAADAWRQLLPLFTENQNASVAQIAKAITKVEAKNNGFGVQVSQILIVVPELISFLEMSAKKDFITDLRTLADSLKPHASIAVAVITANVQKAMKRIPDDGKVLRQGLIDRFITRLETYLFNAERFSKVLIDLESKEVGVTGPELIEIAKEFTSLTTKSKREAIDAIKGKREAIIGESDKSITTSGRTAA